MSEPISEYILCATRPELPPAGPVHQLVACTTLVLCTRFYEIAEWYNAPAVEPIRHTKSARFLNLKMYREELDQLVAFFGSTCAKVTISDNTNRYESLEEMKANIGPRIKDLDIRGENPGVHFLLNQSDIVKGSNPPTGTRFHELRTEETTDAADALFYKIREFLIAHQQPQFRQPFLSLAILAGVICLLLSIRDYEVTTHTIHLSPGWWISMSGAFLSLIVAGSVTTFLTLETKLNSPSFFVKNRDEFAKNWIIAIGTGIIGWLIGHYGK